MQRLLFKGVSPHISECTHTHTDTPTHTQHARTTHAHAGYGCLEAWIHQRSGAIIRHPNLTLDAHTHTRTHTHARTHHTQRTDAKSLWPSLSTSLWLSSALSATIAIVIIISSNRALSHRHHNRQHYPSPSITIAIAIVMHKTSPSGPSSSPTPPGHRLRRIAVHSGCLRAPPMTTRGTSTARRP